MHIIIAGAGKLRTALARWLVSNGHEIAVIEEDATKCALLDEVLGSVSVHGSSVDVSKLARAGANRANVVIATSGDDDVNLVTCQIARQLFGAARTVSVVNYPEHVELFTLLGIDAPVSVTSLLLTRLQESLSGHGVVHLMPIANHEDRMLVSVRIAPSFGKVGRPLKEIALGEGALAVLVIGQDGAITLPSPETPVRAGDEVIVVTSSNWQQELRDLLVERLEK
ncbi:MAG: TrkA family potassium uptake protein [SAR202 cluster bacterium]|nr:TrkA family potassium uptake protein [SAR202 cluster bacterium]